MGYAIAAMDSMSLNAERLDLEYRMQLIADAKMNLGRTVADLLQVGTDLEPDSPVVKKLEQRKERLHLLEKKLDMQMEQYRQRLKAIDVAAQSAEQMMQKNVQKAFSY